MGFRSGADVKVSPLGSHRVLVATVTPSLYPNHIHPVIDADLASGAPGLSRTESRDSNRRWGYSVQLPPTEEVLVRIVDPLGRSTELRAAGYAGVISADKGGSGSSVL